MNDDDVQSIMISFSSNRDCLFYATYITIYLYLTQLRNFFCMPYLGKSVQVPNYDFSTHSRLKTSKTKTPNKIILVEGILIFSSEKLRGLLDVKVFVDADSDSRFMRRLKRDTVERGRSFESVMEQYKKTVRPMHDTYVEPYKLMADIIVPSERLNPVGRQCIVNYLKVQAGLL